MLKAKLGGIDLKNSNEILAEIDKDKTRIN